MRTLDYVLLAVADPAKSAAFYTKLLSGAPVENSPTFVMYVLPNGVKLGLWAADQIEPAAKPAGGIEICFVEASKDTLHATYDAWKAAGVSMLQEPTTMDFGFTFVAEDLDGHRLRPFVPAERPR